MINLRNISKSYGINRKNIVLSDINLSIERGESVAIVGRSGSGKSTLLSILGGLTTVDQGEYSFNEKVVDLSSIKMAAAFRQKNVGIILQNYALLYDRNIYDNILLALDHNNLTKAQKDYKIMKMLEVLDIKKYAKSNPVELSGGECQRVAIGRALVKDPELILADEPSGALDSKTEKTILQHIFNCGKTVVIATHNNDVASSCQRIVRILDGKLVE